MRTGAGRTGPLCVRAKAVLFGKSSSAASLLMPAIIRRTDVRPYWPPARFTLEVNQLQDYSGKGTSVNVGVIHGGTVCNTVPDLCKLTIDRRCYRDEDGQAIDDAIQALARRSCVDGIHVEAKRLSLTPAMPYSEKNRPLIELVNEAARLEGFEAQWADAGGGSDANRIAAAGTPVIDGAGPAGGGFHSANEYLLILTIEPRVRVLSRLLTLL